MVLITRRNSASRRIAGMNWELVFHQQAADILRSSRGLSLRRLRMLLESIARHPLVEPDAICRGASGRPHSIRETPEFTIVYWVDFFVKEVRIVEINPRQRSR
jgi:hypothetical protein